MFGSTNQLFDTSTRIGQDPCALDQASIQNVKACNYLTQNYFAADCTLKRPVQIATSQAGVMLSGGGYGMGAGGCNVDESSRLKLGAQGHPRGRINLFHRPFLTVPYLGRGAVDANLESELLNRNESTDRRSKQTCNNNTIYYHQTPLIPEAHKRIRSMADKMKTNEMAGFRQGGIDTRNEGRDANCEY